MIAFLLAFLLIILHVAPSDADSNLRGNALGAKPEPRIIGGEATDDGRYPYFALMWGSSLCGGALIAPDLVVSAAHCEGAANNVIIGRHSRTNWRNDDSETIDIEEKVVYPAYRPDYFPYDIMIIKLKESSTKPFMKLKAENPKEKQEMTVIGFGDTDKTSALVIPTELHEVQLEYLQNDVCQDMHGTSTISPDMMCALEKNKDSCNGDSGGPLFIKGNSYEEDELVGTVAWGRGCADQRFPGVYSRISFFYEWIVQTGCELSENPPDYFECGSIQVESLGAAGKTTTDSPSFFPSDVPSAVPSESPSLSESPTLQESTVLEFLSWNPPELLQQCQGDCDMDVDCARDMICYQRTVSTPVPGCENSDVPSIADFCIRPN